MILRGQAALLLERMLKSMNSDRIKALEWILVQIQLEEEVQMSLLHAAELQVVYSEIVPMQ